MHCTATSTLRVDKARKSKRQIPGQILRWNTRTAQDIYCHDYLIFLSRRSFSVQVKWLKIKPFSASYNGYERHFFNFLDCWWLSLVSLCNSNRWFAVISSNLVQIPMLSLLARKIRLSLLFLYFFLFDSQECPSRPVFTRGSTIVFAPCIHANKW